MTLSETIMLGIFVYGMAGCYKAVVNAGKYLFEKEEE